MAHFPRLFEFIRIGRLDGNAKKNQRMDKPQNFSRVDMGREESAVVCPISVAKALQCLLSMTSVITGVLCCLFGLLCRWCLIKIYFKLQRLLQDSVH